MAYLKILERSAVFAWSPANLSNLYLAAGTNAQQVDASFSTTSSIDLCHLNFVGNEAFYPNLHPTAGGQCENRFHQLAWADFGGGDFGTLIGGCENGAVVLYDAGLKLGKTKDESKNWCIKQSRKHTGSVRALDLNPFQKQLLASGASNGDVFIFDLNHVEQPMTPGPRPSSDSHQQQQSVVSVGWNGKVEHILATLFPGYAYVWDLRRSDGPIMKLGDLGGGRGQWTALKWHPDSLTTVCLASGDDHTPVVQMWDVRFANAACAQLEGHQRGILSMDWCTKDSDLLVTCDKDSKVYIWNPNTSQFLAEIPLTTVTGAGGLVRSWPFQVQWSKRDPNLIGVASFDGRIAVYSVSGSVASTDSGHNFNATPTATPKLSESFPGADFSYQPAAVQKMMLDRQQHHQQQSYNQPRVVLPYPPKWMRGGCGARFAFGGRLIQFSKPQSSEEQPEASPPSYPVEFFQVVTESTVFEKASELYAALNVDESSQNLPAIAELCGRRAAQASDASEKCVWECLEAHVQRDCRERYVEIVSGSADVRALKEKVRNICGVNLTTTEESAAVVNGSAASSEPEGAIANDEAPTEELEDEIDTPSPWPLPTSPDELGQLELPMGGQTRDGLLLQLITNNKYAAAVELCIAEDKWMEALQLATVSSRHLYDRTQRRYYERLKDPMSKFICLLSNERWDYIIASASLRQPDSWRHIYATILNHVQGEDLAECLEQLGRKMESSDSHNSCRRLAPACYIAAGLVDPLVDNLSRNQGNAPLTADQLHDIVEKATILRVSMGGGSQRALEVGPALADRLGRYASLLAEQGCLTLALQLLDALPDDTEQHLMELRHRVYSSCAGFAPSNIRRPKNPYEIARASNSKQAQQQQHQPAPRSRAGSYAQPPPPPPSYQPYGGANAGVPAQTFNQPPPPPTSSSAAQQLQPVSAMKTNRSRYPSYSSDGISYPTSSAYSAAAPVSYPGQQQQYPSYAASTPVYQQQQPPPPPPAAPQRQTYSNASAYSYVASAESASSASSGGNYSPVATIPHPRLPPPPPGPATQLNHRPWNDPPPLSPKKKTTSRAQTESPAPVTFPVLGAQPIVDQVPTQFYSQPAAYQQQQFAYQQQGHYQQQSNQHSPAMAPTPTPVSAPTIPPEHANILNVFDRLGELTAAKAPNVQTRRRIEDGLQKLNKNLPTLLATAKLSKSTLTELHQIVDYIRAYDYNSALALHSHIVEGADFSTIASFMPSIKVLIQSAAQLGVYYS